MSLVRHLTNKAKHALRAPSARSPQWQHVRGEFLKANPKCIACGLTDNLEAHHVVPFHLRPEWELEPLNLIPLCMGRDRWCHLLVGHGDNFRMFNPNAVVDAADLYAARRAVDKAVEAAILARAKAARKVAP
jgi:hypothetical protein